VSLSRHGGSTTPISKVSSRSLESWETASVRPCSWRGGLFDRSRLLAEQELESITPLMTSGSYKRAGKRWGYAKEDKSVAA
jgi:hypothetical protein